MTDDLSLLEDLISVYFCPSPFLLLLLLLLLIFSPLREHPLNFGGLLLHWPIYFLSLIFA